MCVDNTNSINRSDTSGKSNSIKRLPSRPRFGSSKTIIVLVGLVSVEAVVAVVIVGVAIIVVV